MTHADTLRTWAGQCVTPAARAPSLAGADALDTLDRVRAALDALRRDHKESLLDLKETDDIWDRATADALEHATILITEALEGDT